MQCFNIKDGKRLELQITQTRQSLIILAGKNFKALQIRNHLSNVNKIEGAHVQYMNNHYAKFEY